MTIALATAALIFALIGIKNAYTANALKAQLKEVKGCFAIAYDLLWMQVRDKNDLTYNDMAGLISSMQKSDLMPAVRETLQKRITGEIKPKHLGF